MDCTGLCKNFTIEYCTELQYDCLDWMGIVTDGDDAVGMGVDGHH